LTPRKYQSDETDLTGGITRVGDEMVRTALYEAANSLLSPKTRFSALKRWGLEVAQCRGLKRAKVAVARKLAVILHRMWVDGTPFRRSTHRSKAGQHIRIKLMPLKFIRQQTIDSIIRLRSNLQRTDLALFCERAENASMPVVAFMASRCYRSSRARVMSGSISSGSAPNFSTEDACKAATQLIEWQVGESQQRDRASLFFHYVCAQEMKFR
jgi:hypothetical protein